MLTLSMDLTVHLEFFYNIPTTTDIEEKKYYHEYNQHQPIPYYNDIPDAEDSFIITGQSTTRVTDPSPANTKLIFLLRIGRTSFKDLCFLREMDKPVTLSKAPKHHTTREAKYI